MYYIHVRYMYIHWIRSEDVGQDYVKYYFAMSAVIILKKSPPNSLFLVLLLEMVNCALGSRL